MKTHTSQFKENIKKFGRELDSQITYTLNNEEIVLGNEQLNAITPHYEGDILKSVMKQLDIDSNVDIPIGTEVNYKFGVKTRSGKNLFSDTLRQGVTVYNTGVWNNSVSRITSTDWITLKAGTYTISAKTSYTGSGHLQISNITFDTNGNFYNISGVSGQWKDLPFTFTTPIDLSWKCNICFSDSANITPSLVYDIQVEEGNTATEYEEFGQYEYLDYGNYIVYSSEKQEDTRSYKIVCYDKMLNAMKDYERIDNKNLFNKDQDLTTYTASANNSTITKTKDKITFVANSSTSAGYYTTTNTFRTYIDGFDTSKTYTISADITTSASTQIRFGFEGNPYINTINGKQRISCTSTSTSITTAFICYVYVQGITVSVENIQIEENDTSTSYAPQFQYPITLKNYLWNICSKIGLDFNNTNFVNYDKEIPNELYLDSEGNSLDYTYRDVLDEIAGATASTICINENDELEVRYIKEYKLPSGYTEVDYINADDNRQYIDSGLSLGSNFKIDLTFSLDAYSNSEQPIISTWTSEINYWNLFVRPINNNNQLDLYVKGHYTARANGLVLNEKNNISIERNENNWSLSLDNDKREFSVSSLSDNSTTLKIFRRGDLNGTIFGKIYSLKIYNDNILIRDFIPALRNSDNKVGLYDIVNDVFYVNQGTGDFTYGEVVNESVDLIDEEYLKDINVNFGEKYGPINSVVFSRSAESDNIYRQDEDSIEENGLHEIKIIDNQILNSNNRDYFIDEVFNQLNGFEYYVNDYSSTGIAYYDLCDRYNVKVDENIYSCIMMNDELDVSQGLEEKVHLDIPEKSETDYKKADKTDRRVNETWIIANKQEGYIEALTSRTTSLEENTYTITQVNDLIQNAESGITNTFTEAGGNNIFRNTGLWFENSGEDSQQNPYEFWEGVATRRTEENAINRNAIILQSSTFSQNHNVVNGYYTISFKYKKLLALADVSVVINGNEFELTETDETEFSQTVDVQNQYLDVDFVCDVSDGCEIYDLMVNSGQQRLAYSQNQNETTTDTVNISKGITITSSDLDVKFKADADGIRTLDSSNNIITKFTDLGMTTNEATINGKSTIVGTFWQEIDEQTWITKL